MTRPTPGVTSGLMAGVDFHVAAKAPPSAGVVAKTMQYTDAGEPTLGGGGIGTHGGWGTLATYRSLFEEMAASRDCTDAGIPIHFCVCLSWTEMGKEDAHKSTEVAVIGRAAQHFIEHANKLLQDHPSCATLRLSGDATGIAPGVAKAYELKHTHKEMTAIGRKTDRHGRNVVHGKEQVQHDLEQHLRLVLSAEAVHDGSVVRSGMEYEVAFENTQSGSGLGGVMTVTGGQKVTRVGRLDRYQDDPACIIPSFPALREYCKCVS